MIETYVDLAYTSQELRFIEAIDRILAGRPLEKSLKKKAEKPSSITLNVTNVALEAGFARTYLYKNRETMVRVWARIESCSAPQSQRSDRDTIIRELRDANAMLRAERNLAIDAARRCMQEVIRANENISENKAKARLSQENTRLQARIAYLEGENARLRANVKSGNVVPLRP